MAKSNSFNKRELEKKKQSKRLEKQHKKEERKAKGSSSFEDMIAYVDENGVIRDTPPDPEKREEIELEEIVISTPKKEEADEPEFYTGKVDYFDRSKGFGFIKTENGSDKYFFHKSQLLDDVSEEDKVTYELERGLKGLNAINVKLLK
ncbi:cold-shock protein [Parabacteroides sp. Marseille-P3160]|uniref:cold-shock protein n=1 Tax=Parabacteroides sp. Marseille-P3160 TaxID=1917887 RepID=UPI0009B9761D|nr:cold shock domain-containing protein [Parabacteroides sp. Marseille-P3160]